MKALHWFLPLALMCASGALYVAIFHTERLLENGPLTWLMVILLLIAGLTGIALEIRSRRHD